jgi:hypothetical protein
VRVLWNIDRTGPNLVALLSVSVKFAATSCFFSNRMSFRRSAKLLVHKMHQHPRPRRLLLADVDLERLL